jgi:magnesium-transporting ATPase (P-type)
LTRLSSPVTISTLALGALDFDVTKEDVSKYPKLAYNTGRQGELLNNWNMLRWCSSAFLFGIIIFTCTERIFTAAMSVHAAHTDNGFLTMTGLGFINSDGQAGGIYAEGFLIFSVLVITMQMKVYVMTTKMTYINWTMWILSFIGFFSFAWFLGLFASVDDGDWYHIVNFAFPQVSYYLLLFVCVGMIIIILM